MVTRHHANFIDNDLLTMTGGGVKDFLLGNTSCEASTAVSTASGQLCCLHPTKEVISFHKKIVSNVTNSTLFLRNHFMSSLVLGSLKFKKL